jgi:predicted esterase
VIAHSFSVPKTARYFVSEANPAITTECWIILHGYGHLPEFFMRKFKCLENNFRLLVFPEGLHRFYLNGASGKVGASWMTKEARESDISDNIIFLSQLQQQLVETYPLLNKIIVFGFSQGASTAARWVANSSHGAVKALVVWSSLLPEDVLTKESLKDLPLFMVYGNEDEYVNETSFKEHAEQIKKDFNLITSTFHGKHEIPSEALKTLENSLTTTGVL